MNATPMGQASTRRRWALLIVATAIVYFLTPRVTRQIAPHYEHFAHLAAAFLNGRLSLPAPITASQHVDELIPSSDGQAFYCAYPPLPAILMMPFVLLLGSGVTSAVACQIVSILNVLIFDSCVGRFRTNRAFQPLTALDRILLDAFFAFGTVTWHNAQAGGDWHLAHAVTLAAGLLALREFLGAGRPMELGCFTSLILLTRPTAALACLFLALPLLQPREVAKVIRFSVAPVCAMILLGAYNAARFGNPLDFGYSRMILSGAGKQLMDSYGQFHTHFFFRNFFWFFLAPPWPCSGKSLPIGFDPHGFSLFLASPALLLIIPAMVRGWKNDLTRYATISIVAALVPLMLYFNTGYIQFGHRFSMDYLVTLMLLFLLATGTGLSRTAKSLIVVSIIIQFCGNTLQPFASLPTWLVP